MYLSPQCADDLDYWTYRGLLLESEISGDCSEAVECYKQASDTLAHYRLGLIFLEGRCGVQIDTSMAARHLLLAADAGHPGAQCLLASCYRDGKGVQRNHQRAAELYLRSHDQGWTPATLALSVCYKRGIGVDVSPARSYELLREYGRCSAASLCEGKNVAHNGEDGGKAAEHRDSDVDAQNERWSLSSTFEHLRLSGGMVEPMERHERLCGSSGRLAAPRLNTPNLLLASGGRMRRTQRFASPLEQNSPRSSRAGDYCVREPSDGRLTANTMDTSSATRNSHTSSAGLLGTGAQSSLHRGPGGDLVAAMDGGDLLNSPRVQHPDSTSDGWSRVSHSTASSRNRPSRSSFMSGVVHGLMGDISPSSSRNGSSRMTMNDEDFQSEYIY